MKTTMFVSQFPTNIQEAIKKDLEKALTELELSNEEYTEALENGMDSRLCDLSDTINIKKYL